MKKIRIGLGLISFSFISALVLSTQDAWCCGANIQVIADPIVEAGSLPSVHKLELQNQKLGRNELSAVLSQIRHDPNLEVLSITNTSIDQDSAAKIGLAFVNHPSLHTLILEHNILDNEGATALLGYLANDPKLKVLSLAHNSLGLVSIAIAEFIQKQTSITSLSLKGNYLSDEATGDLTLALENSSTLTYVDLSRNYFSSQSKKALRKIQTKSSKQALQVVLD